MRNWIRQLFNTKKEDVTPLTTQERQNLREDFLSFMDTHPIPVTQSVSLLDRIRLLGQRTVAYGVPQVALIVFFMSSGGVAYMAEHASPGDALYMVKRNLNEEVLMGLTTFSPELRAQVDSTLLARRLEEVEHSITKEDWSEASEQKLRTDIDTHTHALHMYIAKVDAAGETEEALETGSELDALLDTHNSKLYQLWVAHEYDAHDADIELFIKQIEAERGELQKIRKALSSIDESDPAEEVPLTGTDEALAGLVTLHESLTAARENNQALLAEEAYETSGELLVDATEALETVVSAQKAKDDTEAVVKALEEATTKLKNAAALLNI